jgi:hypothetical protein
MSMIDARLRTQQRSRNHREADGWVTAGIEPKAEGVHIDASDIQKSIRESEYF